MATLEVTVMAISDSDTKKAFTTAQGLVALRAQRRQQTPLSLDLSDHPALAESQRALEWVLGSFFDASQTNVDRFEQARARHGQQLAHVAEREREAAIGQSKGDHDRLLAQLESRREAIRKLPVVGGVNPPRVFLDAPFEIQPDELQFDSSQIESAKSWAKFRVESSAALQTQDLSFKFLWKNPSTGYAVINVNAYLVLNGYCEVKSSGGFWAGNRFSRAVVGGNLHLHEWWNDPATIPAPQADQAQQALNLSCSSGTMFDDDAHKAASIFRGFDLAYSMLLIPPAGVVGIDVAATARAK